jgi:hypothetical protein
MFGEHWEPHTEAVRESVAKRANSTLEEKKKAKAQAAAGDDIVSKSGGSMLVGVVAFTLLLTIVLVLLGSGGKVSVNAPKAILFVISGLKGTEFMEAVIDGPYGPNIKGIISAGNGGSYAPCQHADDGRCCRTQDGPRFGAEFQFSAAPGIASILTGVNSNKHRVHNNSYSAMQNFQSASQQYPSVLALAKKAGFTTAVVGSKYMVSALGEDGRCSTYGVLDFECGPDASSRCLARSSCNIDVRVSLAPGFSARELAGPNDRAADEYGRGSDLYASDFGRVFELTNDIVTFINAATDLIVVHINSLELASEDKANGGDYSVTSKKAMSTLYMIDAIIGQVAAIVQSRVSESRENWMLLGVGDHGGVRSTSGNNKDDDEIVAFFGTVYTLAGNLALGAPFPPVRQYDAAPTILKWLGIPAPANLDGTAQMVCSDGINPTNCTKL